MGAIRFRVRKGRQVITPVRFARAQTGPVSAEDPDIDDRGFAMGSRSQQGWGTTDARGPMFGITEGDAVRFALLREDIAGDAPLFVTTEPANLVELVSPLPGQPLGGPRPTGQAGDVIAVRGLKDVAFKCGKIQVRFGSPDGPVVGEIECHIFAQKLVRTVPWLVTIRGLPPRLGLAAGAADEEKIEQIVQDVEGINAILKPTGIRLDIKPDVFGTFAIDRTLKAFGNRPFIREGKVNDRQDELVKKGQWPAPEFSSVVNTEFEKNAVNLYFVRRALGFTAATFDPGVTRPFGFGIVVTDGYKSRDEPPDPSFVLAHEVAHYFAIEHTDEIFDFSVSGSRRSIRADMWTQRELDFSHTFDHESLPHHRDLGYGDGVSGKNIWLKDLRPDATLGAGSHVAQMRRRVRLGI